MSDPRVIIQEFWNFNYRTHAIISRGKKRF